MVLKILQILQSNIQDAEGLAVWTKEQFKNVLNNDHSKLTTNSAAVISGEKTAYKRLLKNRTKIRTLYTFTLTN